MGGSEVRVDLADVERRVTRREVCLACDQCIQRPAMPLACALIVNPDRDYQPCAAKLARMQAHSQARCPHPEFDQRVQWDEAEVIVLGQPVNASFQGSTSHVSAAASPGGSRLRGTRMAKMPSIHGVRVRVFHRPRRAT